MRNALLCHVAFLMLIATPALTQHTAIPKLVIAKGETYTVGLDNTLLVDTLVMHDKASIVFSSDTLGILKAKVALIGNKCVISAKGNDGQHALPVTRGENRTVFANKNLYNQQNGSPGQHGGDLFLYLHLEKLGSLTVDTRGGRGGDGWRDTNIDQSTPESKGGSAVHSTGFVRSEPGHSGGNGGAINLIYSTKNFIPVFNNAKAKYQIKLLSTAGEPGRNGANQYVKYIDADGKEINGVLSKPKDGEIKLTNANTSLTVHE